MNLLLLPLDVLLYQLTLLSIKDLTSFGQTNHKFYKLTNKDYLWQLKSQLDYSTLIKVKNPDDTWKAFYFTALNSRPVPVYYAYNKYKSIFIDTRLALKEITNAILKKLNIQLVNITLLFGISDKSILDYSHFDEILAYSTFDKNGQYYEIIYNDPNWKLTIDVIHLRKRYL